MPHAQGIDIGSWRVRVATMEGSFRRWSLRDVVEMEASVGPAAAVEAIRAGEPGWDEAQRVASLPLDRATVRVVKLPFTDRTTIAKALPAEVESNVPYDLEDMILATRPLDAEKGSSRTRAIIARKDEVKGHLAMLAGAHAEPRILVLDAEALATYSDRGVQCVVDIGHSRTVLALCQGGQLIAARLIQLGGAQLTEAVARAMGVSEAEAEAVKHGMSVPTQPQARGGGEGWTDPEPTNSPVTNPAYVNPGAASAVALTAVVEALDDQLAEIRARLIALEDDLGVGVDELLLAGAGSQLGGLSGRISTWTGLPARAVLVPGGHPPACALAVALARAATGEIPITDLRIGEFSFHGHADTLWNVVAYGGLATAAALLVGTLVVGLRVSQAWDKMHQLDAKIASTVTDHFADIGPDRLTDSSMALAIFKEKADEVHNRVTALDGVAGGDPPVLTLLKRLSDVLPPNQAAKVDIRDLNLTPEALSLKAETDSYESAAKIEEALRSNETFSQARKSDEKKLGDILSFNVSIPLGAPAEDGAAADPAGGKEG